MPGATLPFGGRPPRWRVGLVWVVCDLWENRSITVNRTAARGPDLTGDAPPGLIMETRSIDGGLERQPEEGDTLADHTPYQRKIIERYYKNFDAIKFQRLSELATDLYLAEGKKKDRLWTRVEESLRKIEFPEPRIAILIQKKDPALLVEILKELERGGTA
jgi:hypothetical protein